MRLPWPLLLFRRRKRKHLWDLLPPNPYRR